MRGAMSEAGHLIRLAVLIVALVGAFLLVRQAVIPKAFGQYGHYRPGALEEIRARPMSFAGQTQCMACHEDQAKARATGRHAQVRCEACHGALGSHASDPGGEKPKIADIPSLCKSCHEKDAAKPVFLPQVVSADHYGGGVPCESCHQPHAPKLEKPK